ncbi:MAG: allophanate hydrolase subunit 1 [Deltaproteobacteria bacterium]|nr:allophanate hydrolase subunit 1 [Deltaproteobacteria bacterium]
MTSPPQKSIRRLLGERGLILEFGNQIDPEISSRVRLMASAIEQKKIEGIKNTVPTYRSLLVQYDPIAISLKRLNAALDEIEQTLGDSKPPPGRYFELPTYFGKPYDYDTARIAAHNSLTPEEVVRIFSETVLLVYFIGFIAALPYIGGVPECLHTPRLPSPRVKLPAGVVGLGGQQVALPPVELPSGFNYIGRCFHKLYDPMRFPPTAFQPGDRIRFKAVSLEQAQAHEGEFPEPKG